MSDLMDHLFRREAGRITSRLTRVFGAHRLDLIEDAVQFAMLQALQQWPFQGTPDHARAWLSRVATNRALDMVRAERKHLSLESDDEQGVPDVVEALRVEAPQGRLKFESEIDDAQLGLMFVCCHPALPRAASVALTLKVVCGFGVAEIARAFLSTESAVAQRLVRAKRLIRDHGVAFEIPGPEAISERLEPVLEVLYLFFTEGYAPSAGDRVIKSDLCQEAIRLTGLLAENPSTAQPASHALRALMLFQAARFDSRTDAAGDLMLLHEQDRGLWNRVMISQGFVHLEQAAAGERLTPYHLQAEIAATHVTSTNAGDTPWARILKLYDLLSEMQPSPVVLLNRAIALGQARGAKAGLAALKALPRDEALQRYPFLPMAEGEFLTRLGNHDEAAGCLRRALVLARTEPERRFISRRLAENLDAVQSGMAR